MLDWTKPQHLEDVRKTITMQWIESNVDPEKAADIEEDRQIGPFYVPSGKTDAPYQWQHLVAPGTFAVDRWGAISVLMQYYIDEARPVESPAEWESMLKYNPSVQVYREWARAGHVPPPVPVIENLSSDGPYICQGRRRWLVARDLGYQTLWCWFSPTSRYGTPTAGRALWHKPSWGRYWQNEINHRREIGTLDSLDDYVLADFGLLDEVAA